MSPAAGTLLNQQPAPRSCVNPAVRMLYDWLVVGQIVPGNPASVVRGPKHVVKRDKTPILSPEEARQLFESIPVGTIVGLRDRALIGVLIVSDAPSPALAASASASRDAIQLFSVQSAMAFSASCRISSIDLCLVPPSQTNPPSPSTRIMEVL